MSFATLNSIFRLKLNHEYFFKKILNNVIVVLHEHVLYVHYNYL